MPDTDAYVAKGQGAPFLLALDSTNVFWLSSAGTTTNPSFYAGWTTQTSSTSPTNSADFTGFASGMGVDAGNVYFTGAVGGSYEVAYAPRSGGAASTIYSTAHVVLGTRVAGGAVIWFDETASTIYAQENA